MWKKIKKVLSWLALPVTLLLGLLIGRSSRGSDTAERPGAAATISEQLERDRILSGDAADAAEHSIDAIGESRERIEESISTGERIGDLTTENLSIIQELQRRASERDLGTEEQ